MTEDGPTPPESLAPEGPESPSGDEAAPDFKDYRAGLVVFGLIQVVIALLFLALAAFQLFMLPHLAQSGQTEAVSRMSVLVGASTYTGLGVLAAILGVGAIRCRRWARALNLVLSWLALVFGVLVVVLLLVMLPGLTKMIEAESGHSTGGAASIFGSIMIVGVSFFYLIVPAAFVLFYRSRHVKKTCERYDAKERWTDRRPLPILAGTILLLSTVGSLLAPLMGIGVPFFGTLVGGIAGGALALAMATASLVVALGVWRLDRWAFPASLALIALYGASAYFSVRKDALVKLYETLKVPAEQVEAMHTAGIFGIMAPAVAATTLVMLGFYLWLGRYFRGRAD